MREKLLKTERLYFSFCGLSQPTSGEIEMFGYKNAQLKNVRSRISCLIESPGLYGNMSAYDNLAVKCRLFGINDKRYIENILKTVGLSNVGKKKTIHIYERLDESAAVNMELAKAGVSVRGIGITSEELENYFLNLTGGACNA